MTSPKPTIILVHGSWHRLGCFHLIKERLERLSYEVYAIDSPTTSEISPTLDYRDDVEEIHKLMLPLFDTGKEVTIVGHSYGGLPAFVSTEGQSIAERAQAGKRGGVRSLVLLCALAPTERYTDAAIVGQIKPGSVSFCPLNEKGFLVCNEEAKMLFYHDLPEDDRDFWFSKLCGQSPAVFTVPIHLKASELRVPSMYLIAENDRILPVEVQERMVAAVPGIKTMRLSCGHSPFLSHPDETVEVIVKGAELRQLEMKAPHFDGMRSLT